MESFDIAVIGGGPAGSAAAKAAASHGRKVCLLERKSEIGIPVRCGEGIGKGGLMLNVEPKPGWIKSIVGRAVMVAPDGTKVTVGNVEESYILDREKMDSDLADDAAETGAHLFLSTPVTSIKRHSDSRYECITPKRSFFCSCVIVADGVESKLARDLGWNTTLSMIDIETCAFARVVSPFVDSSAVSFYLGAQAAPGGYVWIFPRGKGEANVGLGILGENSEAGKPREFLKKFIDKEFPGSRVYYEHCGGVPVTKWLRPLVRDGAMLVGDAARQVNCMSGAGIMYSLFAGKCAGDVAAEAFKDGSVDYGHLRNYEYRWKKRFGKQQDRSYALKEFVRTTNDSFLNRIAASLVKEDPDKINYLRVFMRAFAGHPLLLWKATKLFR